MSPQRHEIGRYDQLPGVQIDEARIPQALRALLPFARAWGILADAALERAIRAASRHEIIQAVEASRPLKDAIYDFAFHSEGASATPVPDEVVLFQMFVSSLARLEQEHRNR